MKTNNNQNYEDSQNNNHQIQEQQCVSTLSDRDSRKRRIETYKKYIKITILIFIIIQFIPTLLRITNLDEHIIELISKLIRYTARTLVIFVGSGLTLKIAHLSKKHVSRFRRISLYSLSFTSLFVNLLIPIFFLDYPLPALVMPFPWSSVIFQMVEYRVWLIFYDFASFSLSLSVTLYFIIQGLIFISVILGGRRYFCSMFCTLNGCHAETFGEVLPLIKYKKKKRSKSKALPKNISKIFKIQQIIFLVIYIAIMITWVLYFSTGIIIIPLQNLMTIELVLYFVFALGLLLIFWIFFGGRGYCYYCPAGSFLGIISRISGQQITTNLTKCTSCGLCSDACKMSIDVMDAAIKGVPLKSIDCVGCGLCVDACPQHNLEYSTAFSRKLNKKKKSK